MRLSFSRRVWMLLGAAVLLTVVLVALSRRQPAPRVAVVKAARENLVASIVSNGKVEPITPYTIRAQLITFVEKVAAVEGQAVKRGQLLLTLDAGQSRAELARARENLVAAEEDLRSARAGGRADEKARLEADLRKAELDRDRLRREREALERLLAKQAATRDELDQNQLALARAEADVVRLRKANEEFARSAGLLAERARLLIEQYRTEIRSLEEKVRSAEVTAPIDGTLYSLPVKERDYVQVGALLAELADLRRVRIRAFIDEPELGSLEPGQPVVITWDALPGQSWQGRTEMIPKQVVARGTRSVGEVLCSVENEKLRLLPNINVSVRINIREKVNVLTVPRGAIETEGQRHFAYLVEGGGLPGVTPHLRKREVQVGISSATRLEITSGLKEDDVLALPGDTELRDGMPVRVFQAR